MITLYIFPGAWGAVSASPYCIKAVYLLNASGLPFEIEETNDPRPFPQGKLPAIKVDGRIIGDSDNLRSYLAEAGHDVDAHLSKAQRAEGMAWQRLAEEHLYHHIVLDRWINPAVWPEVKTAYFGSLPFPLKHIVPGMLRRGTRAGLTYMGHARQSGDMRMARLEQDFHAITQRFGSDPFLFGEQVSSFDASLASMLESMRSSPVKTALSSRVSEDAALVGYADRVKTAMGSDTNKL